MNNVDDSFHKCINIKIICKEGLLLRTSNLVKYDMDCHVSSGTCSLWKKVHVSYMMFYNKQALIIGLELAITCTYHLQLYKITLPWK